MKSFFAFHAVVLFASAGCLWAQSTAQISGRVTDASGAAVAGTKVRATQTATDQVRTVEAGADAGYVLAGNSAIQNVRNYPTIVISVAGGQGGNTAMHNLDGALHEDPYSNLRSVSGWQRR